MSHYGNVVAPFSKGRNDQGDHLHAVIEIAPERARLHRFAQVPVGRHDNAHIDLRGMVRPDFFDLAILHGAQQLDLHGEGHFPDLVEKQSPAVGALKQALLRRVGVGEGTLDVPEQLALEQGFRNRRAVQGDERPLGAAAVGMDYPGHDFFSGSGFAQQTNRRIGVGHLCDLLEQPLHLRAPRNDVFHSIQFLDEQFEPLNFATHPLLGQRLFQAGLQLLVVKRLGEVPRGAPLHRLHRVRNAAVRGEDDDRQARMNPEQLFRDHQPVFALQAQVGNGQIKHALSGLGKGLLAGRAGGDGEAHGREPHLQEMQQPFVVVDHKNLFFVHGIPRSRFRLPFERERGGRRRGPRRSGFFSHFLVDPLERLKLIG